MAEINFVMDQCKTLFFFLFSHLVRYFFFININIRVLDYDIYVFSSAHGC